MLGASPCQTQCCPAARLLPPPADAQSAGQAQLLLQQPLPSLRPRQLPLLPRPEQLHARAAPEAAVEQAFCWHSPGRPRASGTMAALHTAQHAPLSLTWLPCQ